MSKTLVIVESPAKAKTITRFLGSSYTVRASMGHVRDLPAKELGVEVATGTFKPTYVAVAGRSKTISEIRALAKDATHVLLATDPDREGEAIAWHIVAAAGLGRGQQQISRVEFHEITERAITAAINHPRQLDMNLVNAQQARRVLDRLVGYKLSPLLWKKVQRGTSAGRVQSVALRIIIEREREIEAFVPREYWTIEADLARSPFSRQKADIFHAALWNPKEKRRQEFENGDQAGEVLAKLDGAGWTVGNVTKKEGLRRPSAPFITSTLQQEAARKLRLKTQDTMKIAQQLYEGVSLGPEGTTGLITYMRTDSTQVAGESQQAAREVIKDRYGPDYLPDRPPFYAKKAKGAQEAHEAIRPTKPGRQPEAVKAYLTPIQFRLYQLIWRRFIASQMAPARIEQTTVDIEARPRPNHTSPEVYPFRASGERVIFPGFLAVYREGQGDSEEDEDAPAANREGSLPRLETGNPLDLLKLLPEQHFTEPPPRFGEASLIKVLEELGVGRPSTYATIMSTIRDRGYVVETKDGKERKFHPTELGRAVNDLLVARFPDLLDVQFTARLEGELDDVAEGKLAWTPLVASVYGPMMAQLAIAEREVGKIEVPAETLPIPEKPAGRSYGRSGSTGSGRGSYKRPSRAKAGTDSTGTAKPWEPSTTGTARPRRTTRATAATGEAAPVKRPTRRKAVTVAAAAAGESSGGSAVKPAPAAVATGETCPLCQQPMVRRKGPYGEFLGCTGYPKCKGTRKG
ncbi:MAG: topoisomerase 1 [Chloroflexi bacterium]|nr:topoisomerase 1 [Chloroflexota bacterium]